MINDFDGFEFFIDLINRYFIYFVVKNYWEF